jgi:hypothetical protein
MQMQWRRGLLGACTFGMTHILLVVMWHKWFDTGNGEVPWFMNSVSAVTVASMVFATVSAVDALVFQTRLDASIIAATNVTGGAVAIMIVVLFSHAGGPGTLFPVAILIGAFILVASGVVGAIAGSGLRLVLSRFVQMTEGHHGSNA